MAGLEATGSMSFGKDISKPKVSVIIPCYNCGLYVAETIESVLRQTYSNIEIVCVNDCSSDNSSEVIKKYADKYENILFLDEKVNRGVCYARNLAVENSSGEYILPLDADDIIEPEYIEKAAEVLNNRPEIGIVYCKARIFGSKNKLWKLPEFDKDKILYQNCIFNSAMFRKKDFLKCGGYNENMKNGCEDWDLWLSFVENGFLAYRIDEVLFKYRKTKQASRSNVADKSANSFLDEMVKNHINLYLKNTEFYDRIFDKQKKKKKYKKWFNIFLIISILEFVLIIIGVYKCFLL